MAKEENVVPPAKYIFLIGLVLIAMIGGVSSFSFQSITGTFMENLAKYGRWEIGREGMDYTGVIYVDVGIDMKNQFNETHGVVYWYNNIELMSGASVIDLLQNLTRAESVELRIYDLKNPSDWKAVVDKDVNKYMVDVEYGNVSGVRYIYSINGVKTVPGNLTQWMVYLWDVGTQGYNYLSVPPDKLYLTNKDSLVLLYDKFGGYPLDCCSGGSKGFEYEEYGGPTK